MSDVKVAYTDVIPIACTLTSLAVGGARESDAVDNKTSTKYLDALVRLKTKTATGSVVTSTIELYVWGSLDGTSFPDNCDGTNSGVTQVVPPNTEWLGRICCPTASTAYVSNAFSVCKKLGVLALPPYWGVIVLNNSNTILSATAGDHVLSYVGIYQTISA